MIQVKSFEEIKGILAKFKEFSRAGYVVTPQVLKIASVLGFVGYADALNAWRDANIFSEKVFDNEADAIRAGTRIIVNWEGTGLRKIENTWIIGLRRTVEDIEEALK